MLLNQANRSNRIECETSSNDVLIISKYQEQQ